MLTTGLVDFAKLAPQPHGTTAAEDDWHAWRNEGITASEIATAYCRAYGKTPRTVVAQKLGRLPAEVVAEDMRRRWAYGHALEPVVAASTTAALGLYVAGEQSWVEHPELGWPRATVDGFLVRSPGDELADAVGLLEIKTTTSRSPNWKLYGVQVQWQLLVAGLGEALIACWQYDHNDDQRKTLTWRPESANPALQQELLALGEMLWGHVQAGTLPTATE